MGPPPVVEPLPVVGVVFVAVVAVVVAVDGAGHHPVEVAGLGFLAAVASRDPARRRVRASSSRPSAMAKLRVMARCVEQLKRRDWDFF